MTTRTPIEQAAIFLSLNNPRKAAEIMLQIIMEQENRLREVEKRLPEQEVTFTDGLEEDDNFPDPLPGNYCERCQGPCKRTGCIYCGADFDKCECE